MVVLSEIKNMFWGITLDVGNRYSQTVERSFHISMAAVDPSSVGKDENVSLMLQYEKAEFMLCTLNQAHLQQQLDLNFTEGEEVTFFLKGKGVVHLTGYLVPEEDEYPPDMSFEEEDEEDESVEEDSDEEDEDDDDEDEEVPELQAIEDGTANGKRKKKHKQDPAVKKMRFDEQDFDDSDDEEDTDFSMVNFDDDDDEDDDEDEEDEEDDDDDSDEDDEDEDEEDDEDEEEEDEDEEDEEDLGDSFMQEKPASAKKNKKNEESQKKQIKTEPTANGVQHSPSKQKGNTPKGNLTVKEEKKTPKGDKTVKAEKLTPKEKKTPKEGKTPKEQKSPKETPGKGVKKVIAGGVTLEEVKEGHGPEAKQGKMVHVYYTGKLASGKQFDACTSGKPFKFKLGKGEVVKGWDIGLQGMKVGGKRKLTIPPAFGYGSRKMGPIPANSTLVFDVELKAVS